MAAAAFGNKYRSVGRAGAAGCVGITLLDTTMLITVTLALHALIGPMTLAVTPSPARLIFTARSLGPVLTG